MPPRQQGGNAQDGDEPTIRNTAENIGFFDDGIPPQLYTLWRSQVHRGVQNWGCYGAGEAGIIRWGDFCEWAAGQPTMAPRGQVQYNRDVIHRNVRILYDDIAKKGRNSRQSMWDTVQRARAAHRAANPEGVIEPLRWLLPDIQQLGQSTTGPPYIPQNPRGRASTTLLNATQESNTERARIAACRAQGPGPAAPAVAPAAQGPALAPAPSLAMAAPTPALAVAAPVPAVLIPPGMQQVAIVVPLPSLPAGGGGVVGGLLAGHSCCRAVPHG
ncbi:hypothetical protein L211DRAFT_847248 [Terfezia boudieri ATCC MYA-4762]|uniref:Uncharacterized protein n=1 Tax=Terfezia boudieri ATCC MYA-4762 TaxID=1051890 RepID=A0A3N4LZS3_9PEZI|nr:hypothetical protein L211DRAFT_847248 [Terfezia boudieri ATCC MYA-4762]